MQRSKWKLTQITTLIFALVLLALR